MTDSNTRINTVLIHECASALGTPRLDPADSFVLHAPLELLARVGLLRHVADDSFDAAYSRISELGALYTNAYQPYAPADLADGADTSSAKDAQSICAQLTNSIQAGDLEATDLAARHFGEYTSPDDLAGLLGAFVLPRLSAAAHGAIALFLFPKTKDIATIRADILRGTMRELARHPEAILNWPAALEAPDGPGEADVLAKAVANTKRIDTPDSNFIWPMMAAAGAYA